MTQQTDSILCTVLLLAATMQGETEILHSDEAALAVYEVAWNRRMDPRFPDDLRKVLEDGFNGWRRIRYVKDIDRRYIGLACRALVGEHRWTHKALYMLSGDDLVALGGVADPPLKHWRNGRWAVYLYEEWPR